MVPTRDIDCGEIYERKRRELVALLTECGAEELAQTVPATPAWSVRDVLAHVVGVAADLNAQDFGTGDPEAWTSAQVAARRDKSVADLGREWDREAPMFEEGLRLFGYELGCHYVGDLLQHTGDVRHALGLTRPADDEALVVALDLYLMSFDDSLTDAQLGAVEITVDPEHWTLASGPVVASISADRYELFRSLGGRRSENQVRALQWSGDVDAIVALVSRYPMSPAPIVTEVTSP